MAAVTAAPPRLGQVRTVAVDGPSGSGKTTFADRLRSAFHRADVHARVVHTDDLLDGWGRPDSWWPRFRRWISTPLATGEPARHQVYDWHAQSFDAQWREVGRPEVLIVEGVTSAAAPWRPRLNYSVYMDADSQLRLRRSLARDGEAIRGELAAWRQAEAEHFASDATRSQVDLVVDGQASRHDDAEFFALAR